LKAGFLNNMVNEELGEYKGKTIYRLKENLYFRREDGSLILIPAGFQTDLASVPRLPFIYTAWGNRSHREAVLHDWLYRLDSDPLVSRLEADDYFRLAMISRHQPWRIYYPMFLGVRAFGWTAYHKLKVGHEFIK